MKPREFWISGRYLDVASSTRPELFPSVHVVEMSALEQAQARIKELENFIGNEIAPSWLPSGIRIRRHEILKGERP